MSHPAGIPTRPVDFSARPMLVFWEITRSCLLACKHCRASATPGALPGQLDHAEGMHLIDQVAAFGRPYPILVLTGGDCLLRDDVFDLVAHATELGVPVCLSPSVTPMLTPEAIERMASSGVKAVSLSLDGACAATHDGVRGIPGHFEKSLPAIKAIKDAGIKLQINTTVMSGNVHEMPDIAKIVKDYGVDMWEVFFLVHVGRGEATGAISPQEHEDVCHFLYDASHHGFVVRTVEAPFFRRVVHTRRAGGEAPGTELYAELSGRLTELCGEGNERASAHTAATRDGKGIVFVAHDGQVYPAGFLPLELGSVRDTPLAEIYRDHPTLTAIRAAEFTGKCGVCEFADLCGGSRARAYAASGDPLGEDTACSYIPTVMDPEALVAAGV
ncbi:MAG TPA: TIGR04053 family radical SAM/SPASM domain-containing protein [Candidatus Nanopelagicales bacterium]|nr:TIGR04053 family radical SAM/SPASM domain-containing protein [Candidatus Nanopelagicales bacterium]